MLNATLPPQKSTITVSPRSGMSLRIAANLPRRTARIRPRAAFDDTSTSRSWRRLAHAAIRVTRSGPTGAITAVTRRPEANPHAGRDVPAAEVGEREDSPAVLLDRRVRVLEPVGAEVAVHRVRRHPVLPDEVDRRARVVAKRREGAPPRAARVERRIEAPMIRGASPPARG